MNRNTNTIEAMESKLHFDYKRKPTTSEEWADQHFRYGAHLGGHGIPLDELRRDWPEVLTNKDFMRGYREGWDDAVKKGLL